MNLVENGDFETEDFSGWYIHHGYVYMKPGFFNANKSKRTINWDQTESDQPSPVIADNSLKLPQMNGPVPPYGGQKMALINDLDGGNHVTCLHQDFYIPQGFAPDCAYVSFDWGALLQGSGHNSNERPQFTFEVRRHGGGNWRTLVNHNFIATEGGGNGWSDIRALGEANAVWYKAGSEKFSVAGFAAGDMIRIRFVAEDCAEGGHGGAAFIDNVVFTNGCGTNSSVDQTITFDSPLPNVFTPNNDGTSDVWTVNNLHHACKIEFELFDRWGDRVFYNTLVSHDGSWPAQTEVWNGLVRSRRRKIGWWLRKRYVTRKIRKADMSSNTVYYVIRFSNCAGSIEVPGFMSVFI